MKIASEIETREELSELKSVMEIFLLNSRVHELAELSHIYNISDYFKYK